MANGRLRIGSFWDHHGHLCQLGSIAENLDLRGAASPEAVYLALRRSCARRKKGEWVSGFGWDQNLWNGRSTSLPGLDSSCPDNPVFLTRIDCHAALVNSAALDAAGLSPGSKVEGGYLEKLGSVPTGVAVDKAMAAVSSALPAPTGGEIKRRVSAALSVLKRYRLSGATDMWLDEDEAVALSEMDLAGELSLPVLGYIGWESLPRLPAADPPGGGKFRIAGAKVFIDGALGSRGAALSVPYRDDPGNEGLLLLSGKEILQIIGEADRKGIDLAFHAIGDRAIEEFASGCEKYGRRRIRIRLEHVQVAPRRVLDRLSRCRVTASLQPSHFISDAPWAKEKLGPLLMNRSYLLRSVARVSDGLLLGTDFPIEPPDPLRTIYSCFKRRKSEQLSLKKVLKAMECPGEFASFARPLVVHGFSEAHLGDPEKILSWKVRYDAGKDAAPHA